MSVNESFPFTPGVNYADTVYFSNVTNTQGNTSRAVNAIIIDISQGVLTVTPARGFHSEALPGGPFNPAARTFVLQNAGGSVLDWTAGTFSGQNRFLLSKSGGSLQPFQVDSVTVTVNSSLAYTPGTNYADTVYFTNATNTQGNTSPGG